MIGIYGIYNKTTGKRYIGQSINIESRIDKHFRLLHKGEHFNNLLQSSYNKYGKSEFDYEVLCECEKSELDSMEIYYIDYFNSKYDKNGYNLKDGGSCPPLPEKSKLILSELGKNRVGSKNSFFGKIHTSESKNKMSKSKMGKTRKERTEQHRQSLSVSRQGKLSSGKSKFVGVTQRPNGKWQANITILGKKLYLGVYDLECDAAKAYDNKVLSVFGDKGIINFYVSKE